MKTASLGLLEVMVIRVNAGGGCPPGPYVGDVTGPPFPLSLFSSRKFFGELAGGLTVKEITINPNEQRRD